MLQKKQIFQPNVLRNLLTEENGCISLIPTVRCLALPPCFLTNIKTGIFFMLNNALKKYDPNLDGILIGYQNVKILMDDRTGLIPMGVADIRINVSVEFFIFQPKIGGFLQGVVNKKSSQHIGCLVHKYFNATILKPDNVEYKFWNCRNIKENDLITFKVTDLDFTGELPRIEGTIVDNKSNTENDGDESVIGKVGKCSKQTGKVNIPKDESCEEDPLKSEEFWKTKLSCQNYFNLNDADCNSEGRSKKRNLSTSDMSDSFNSNNDEGSSKNENQFHHKKRRKKDNKGHNSSGKVSTNTKRDKEADHNVQITWNTEDDDDMETDEKVKTQTKEKTKVNDMDKVDICSNQIQRTLEVNEVKNNKKAEKTKKSEKVSKKLNKKECKKLENKNIDDVKNNMEEGAKLKENDTEEEIKKSKKKTSDLGELKDVDEVKSSNKNKGDGELKKFKVSNLSTSSTEKSREKNILPIDKETEQKVSVDVALEDQVDSQMQSHSAVTVESLLAETIKMFGGKGDKNKSGLKNNSKSKKDKKSNAGKLVANAEQTSDEFMVGEIDSKSTSFFTVQSSTPISSNLNLSSRMKRRRSKSDTESESTSSRKKQKMKKENEPEVETVDSLYSKLLKDAMSLVSGTKNDKQENTKNTKKNEKSNSKSKKVDIPDKEKQNGVNDVSDGLDSTASRGKKHKKKKKRKKKNVDECESVISDMLVRYLAESETKKKEERSRRKKRSKSPKKGESAT
ncbi:hypothetical protein RUM44_009412 [Polyplax serrata]|uniref:DNA-directed RNA polymerase I subunit RPA43 n=1 Tax=Polyplax serrata TaxID=468196 RepID=A0ABR1ASM0_POLSC